MLTSILQPGGQVVEGLSASDVVHQQSTSGASVVRASDGAESLRVEEI